MTASAALTALTETQLETAVEENLFDLFRAMTKILPDSELKESNKLSCHLSFPARRAW